MSSNYLPEVATAKEAAENSELLLRDAEERLKATAAELEAQAAEELEAKESDGKSKVDPTLNIRMRTLSTLSRLAVRAAEHVEKARRAAETLKRAAADSADPSEQKKLAEAAEKAAGHRDTAELCKNEIKRLAENAHKEADAATAAEKLLNLEEYFSRQNRMVYQTLEHYDKIATEAGANSDMVFFAEGLPFINGIINIGSTHPDYEDAVGWVKKVWGHMADPLLVLSALVFIYVVNRGAMDPMNKEDIATQATWERIRDRVRRLL